ncbi:MAG TPA: FtsX-like permease family protein, partial [Acidimicrobiales bacterium]
MIRLGLRLSLAGGRESAARLAVTAAAVALGVGLLLVTLGGINALHASDRRSAWLGTSVHNIRPSVDEATTDPLWAVGTLDEFGSGAIDRVDVAATGPRSPVPPGIPSLPGPREYYASPAMTRLLRSTPADELGDRYPGRQIGTIGNVALSSPDSLVIIVGRTVQELSHTPGAREVRSIETAPQGSSPFNHHPGRLELILAVVAGALLFPVLIFIATATRLAAAQREQRFAAMRLVGATPAQVSVISAVEAVVAAGIGVAGGVALFVLLRPALAKVPFTGQPFFAADLSLSAGDLLLVALGIPIAAAVVAMLALRRVDISPLGVTRRVPARAPRAWRLLPLVAGVGELAYFVGVGTPSTTGQQIEAYGVGFVLAVVGLLVAGPWLTMSGSRLMARRANRPAGLIAGRRLSDNPRAAFRSVSGLIIALFITTTAVGVI